MHQKPQTKQFQQYDRVESKRPFKFNRSKTQAIGIGEVGTVTYVSNMVWVEFDCMPTSVAVRPTDLTPHYYYFRGPGPGGDNAA